MITGIELAKKILKHVTEHPEQHRQERWVGNSQERETTCGTTACLAGWAILFNREKGETVTQAKYRLAAELSGGYAELGWDAVALLLLFSDTDDVSVEIEEDDEPAWVSTDTDAATEVQSAFFRTDSEREAIEKFAAAFGLVVPQR